MLYPKFECRYDLSKDAERLERSFIDPCNGVDDMSENEEKTGRTESQVGDRQQGNQPGATQKPRENNVDIPKNEERRSNQTPGAGSGGEGG